MGRMDRDTQKMHIQAVIDALPENLKDGARMRRYASSMSIDGIDVEIEDTWYSEQAKMKASPDYTLQSLVGAKTRTWKHRQRDQKFSYNLVVKYIVNVLGKMQKIKDRRSKGRSIALQRAAKLEVAFKRDPMLSTLNLDVNISPVRNTEVGEVDIEFRGKNCAGAGADFHYNGETFDGNIDVSDLSAEQVTAIMVVLRVDQLKVLDLLAFADDSILGPSIKKLAEDMGSV